MVPLNSFKFIDLFAGLGGFHLALVRLGGKCVFAAEWNEGLQELYKTNFGIKPFGDITEVIIENVPDHDILTAGFPCQPFSKAGEQLGFECTKQGNLFFNVVEILKQKNQSISFLKMYPIYSNMMKDVLGGKYKNCWEKMVLDIILMLRNCHLTILVFLKFGNVFTSSGL